MRAHALDELARDTADGGPGPGRGRALARRRAALQRRLRAAGGAVTGRVYKHALPNYGVFDEKRVFQPGPIPGPVRLPLPTGEAVRLGVMVCEDMWFEDVAEGLGESGAEILVVPNGSPFEHGKQDQRLQLAVARVTETGLPLLYVNQVGGQDELVFDGGSFALDADRRLVAQAPSFVEALTLTRWRRGADERLAPVGARRRSPRPCRTWRRSTAPWSWACATMSTRTAFPASCSACRAASIRRSRRRSPSMRSAPTGSTR